MRLLLDESVPVKLRRLLPEYVARTVVEMGWSGVKNGELLARAGERFDVFVTVDKNLPYQQNLTTLPLAVVVLDAPSNDLAALRALVPAFVKAMASLEPKTYVRIRTKCMTDRSFARSRVETFSAVALGKGGREPARPGPLRVG